MAHLPAHELLTDDQLRSMQHARGTVAVEDDILKRALDALHEAKIVVYESTRHPEFPGMWRLKMDIEDRPQALDVIGRVAQEHQA